MTVITNDEACRRLCLDCKYAGGDLSKDSCIQCGTRYEPTEDNEFCPECDCAEYDSHCPKCDSTEIFYYKEALEILAAESAKKQICSECDKPIPEKSQWVRYCSDECAEIAQEKYHNALVEESRNYSEVK